MKRWVIDASVAAKWVFPERGSDQAVLLREAARSGEAELLAPDFFVAEIGNLTWKKAVLLREISPAEARTALGLLKSALPRLIPSTVLLDSAMDLALAHRQSLYDCLYVALALASDCKMVTADDGLRKAMEGRFECLVSLSAIGPENPG